MTPARYRSHSRGTVPTVTLRSERYWSDEAEGVRSWDGAVPAIGLDSLRTSLKSLGYVEGQNLKLEYRWIAGVNFKTAKALGLTIPPALLARADQVIE